MKILSTTLFFVCVSIGLYAQTDRHGINYQAVARDANGDVIVNQDLKVKATILQDGADVYSEVFDPVPTGAHGVFTIVIGSGTDQDGAFNAIDWSVNKPHALRVEIDKGDGLEVVGEMSFVSVPYAFIADSAIKGQTLKINTTKDSISISGGNTEPLPPGAPDADWTAGSNLIYNDQDQVAIGLSNPPFGVINNRLYVSGTGTIDSYSPIIGIANANITQTGFLNLGTSGVSAQVNDNGQTNILPMSGMSATVTQNGSDDILVSGFSATVSGTGSGDKYGLSVIAEGDNNNILNVGVRGAANGNGTANWGVYGTVDALGVYASQNNIGVLGNVDSLIGGGNLNVGVYGKAGGGNVNFAFYGEGEAFLSGGTLWTTSDEKLKSNITPISNALQMIKQIQPMSYKYNYRKYPYMNFPKTLQYGVLAGNLEAVAPHMVRTINHPIDIVSKENNGTIDIKAVNYGMLTPVLIKAIQEQQEIIESLEKRIEALEKK